MSKTVKKKSKAQSGNVWDDFWTFVKQNEKVAWVVLLVLISFSFAFPTGSFFQSVGREYPRFQIFGETIYNGDYRRAGEDVQAVQEMRGRTAWILSRAGLVDEIRPEWFRVSFHPKDPLTMVDYFLYLREADRLGIYVSDSELGEEIRLHYQAAKARDDAFHTPTAEATSQMDREALTSSLKALHSSGAFDFEEWSRLLQRQNMGEAQGFEKAVRKVLRADKVVEYVRDSVQVSGDEVWQRFLSEEELRKVSFFKIEDDGTLKEKAGSEIDDADLRKYYDGNPEKFQIQSYAPKLRVSYVYLPYKALEDQIEPTEEDLEEHYRKIRDSKYLKPLDVDATQFELLTAEQEKEREKEMYVPLEEVREEVLEDYTRTEARKRARDLGRDIARQLFPGGDKEEEVDRQAVLAKLLEKNSSLESGKTPFFSRYEVSDKAPRVNSSELMSWFTNLTERDPAKKKPIEISRTFKETQDAKGLVLYTEVETLESGQETFEKLVDQVREALVTSKVLEGLGSRADSLVERIGKGELSLEKAAEESGSGILESSYQKKTGQIWVPAADEEDDSEGDGKQDEKDSEEEDSKPKTEYLRASRAILQAAFTLSKGEVASVPDENDGVIYVVRLDGQLSPAPQDFDEDQKSRYRTELLNERREAYFASWRKDLWTRAHVKQYETTKS